MRAERKHIFILTLIALLLFFFRIGRTDFYESLVARNALMAQEMIERGEWIVPHVNGHPDYEKPILWIWILSLFSLPLGVNEFSIRFPCALAALGTVYVVYALGRRLMDSRGGFRAALVYMTSVKVMHLARVPRIDMSLSLLIALTFFFFLRGYGDEKRRRSSYLLAAVFAALGVLDKGPLGVVLPGGGIFFYLLFRRDLKGLLRLLHPLNVAVFLLVAAPWYLMVHGKTGGAFSREFFLYHNFTMFAAYTRSQPLWFYLPQLLFGFLPWSVFLPFALVSAFGRRERETALFPLCWFLWGFVFFSLSVYKRSDYILPLYPAAALITALFWNSLEEGASRWAQFAPKLLSGLLAAVCAAGLIFMGLLCVPGLAEGVIGSDFVDRFANERDLDLMRIVVGILRRGALVVIPCVAGAGLFFFLNLRRLGGERRRVNTVLAGTVAFMVLLNTFYLVSILPELNPAFSQRAYGARLTETVRPRDRFALYDFWLYEFGYYMRRRVTELEVPDDLRAYFSRPELGYCMVKRKNLDEALEIISDLPHRVEADLADPRGRFDVIVRPADG